MPIMPVRRSVQSASGATKAVNTPMAAQMNR